MLNAFLCALLLYHHIALYERDKCGLTFFLQIFYKDKSRGICGVLLFFTIFLPPFDRLVHVLQMQDCQSLSAELSVFHSKEFTVLGTAVPKKETEPKAKAGPALGGSAAPVLKVSAKPRM